MAATKTCTLCGEDKPLSEYGKHSKTKDGLQQRCKPCRRESRKASDAAFRELHRERLREYNREWVRDWRRRDPDASRKKSRQWYAANLEKARLQTRESERRRRESKAAEVRAIKERAYRKAVATTAARAKKVGEPWTEEEDAVASRTDLSAVQVALMLGRTVNAVAARRLRLANEEYVKTRSRTQEQKDRERTLPEARNWGKRWTGPELEIVANYEHSAVEAALLLGRTADAVEAQRLLMQKDPRKARLAGLDTDVARKADP